MIGCEGAMPQVDIITGERRRRIWTMEEKQAVLAAAFAPGVGVRQAARRIGVTTGQIYTWRKELMNLSSLAEPAPVSTPGQAPAQQAGGPIKNKPESPGSFSRVVAAEDLLHPRVSPQPTPALPPPAATAPQAPACELPAIEIEAGDHKIRIPPTMPVALASAVVRALVLPSRHAGAIKRRK
jgi:transposase